MEPRGNGNQTYESVPPPYIGDDETHFTPPGTLAGQIKYLFKDASLLVRKEIELARSEMSEKADHLKRGAGYMGAAAALAFAGLLGLCASAMWLLAIWLPLWLSSLIVSAVVLVIGGLLFAAGKRDMSSDQLTPDRTMTSLKRDQRLVQEHMR